MKLHELANVSRNCALHLVDITHYPGVDCGTVNAEFFNEVGDVQKYKDYEVKSIYTNEGKDPDILRVEISEK